MNKIKKISKNLRINILQLSHEAKSSHIGGCLSIVEILSVLFNSILGGFSKPMRNLKFLGGNPVAQDQQSNLVLSEFPFGGF